MRVFVYFNLRRKTWSIKALSGPSRGKVIAHAVVLRIRDATFKVSEAGRQRVLRERVKNVHAGVVGNWVDTIDGPKTDWRTVTYNPYKGPTFVHVDDASPIHSASEVFFSHRSVCARE